jgi:hypothetical protein
MSLGMPGRQRQNHVHFCDLDFALHNMHDGLKGPRFLTPSRWCAIKGFGDDGS